MSDYDVDCPHRDCSESLHLTWSLAYTLSPTDLDGREAHPTIAAHHASSWQVECSAGHVLLIPGTLGCPCNDGGGDACPHNEDDYDWSDDNREFQPHDLNRLLAVLAALADPADTGGAS